MEKDLNAKLEAAGQKKTAPTKIDARLVGNIAPIAGLVLVVVVFAILTKGALLSINNIQAMSSTVIMTAMCAIGAVFVFGTGYFDMSIGGTVCIAAVLGGQAMIATGSFLVGFLVILAVSIALALVKGLLAAYVNIPFFIFTIILASIFSSAVLVIMGNETIIYLKDAVKPLREFNFTEISIISIIVLAVFFIFCLVVFKYTPVGIKAKNMGGNIISARQSGINTTKTTLMSARIDAACAGFDIAGYNYMTARYELDAVQNPHRVVVGSETYPPEIARNWTLVEKLPSVIGDFTWTGWDYIGEAGIGIPAYRFGEGGFGAQFPCQLAFCGDIDITGFRRPASYFREIVFGLRQSPYITVQDPAHYGEHLIKTAWIISDSRSSWSWPGFEGKPAIVEVYSPGTEVELLLNGTSLGKQPCGPAHNYTAYFETTYQPGTLVAVAYDGDAELGRMDLTTAGHAAQLTAEAEPSGDELIYVNLTLRDVAGRVADAEDAELRVSVIGGAMLAGLGNGDPKPIHGCAGDVTRTYHGRALAILRRTDEGEITLTAKTDSGLDVSLSLT